MPEFLFNSSPGNDSEFRHIDCQIVPPCCCSAGNLICLKRTSPMPNGLLKSALLTGVLLTRAQIEKCMAAMMIPHPPARPGKTRLLKHDLAKAMVQHVLQGESREVIAKVLRRQSREPTDDDSDVGDDSNSDDDDNDTCPDAILRIIQAMDADNKEHFRQVQREAGRLLERRVQREAAARPASSRRGPGNHHTPITTPVPDETVIKHNVPTLQT